MRATDVNEWLNSFTEAVNHHDYDAAMNLFLPHVIGFGTRACKIENRTQLRKEQWEKTWPHITAFRFYNIELTNIGEGDDYLVTGQWETDNGKRSGRCTLFIRDISYVVCTHSHFSLNPTPEFG